LFFLTREKKTGAFLSPAALIVFSCYDEVAHNFVEFPAFVELWELGGLSLS